jgi:serine protease Do
MTSTVFAFLCFIESFAIFNTIGRIKGIKNMNTRTVITGIMGLFLLFPRVGFALNAEQIYQKVSKSVYTLYTVNFYEKRPESLGSAIAVTEHVLATNCHVALTGNYLGIIVNNEFKLGTIFFRDLSRDICFVEVPGMKFDPIKIRNSKDVKVGEQVYAIGNPEGLEKTITQGIISNKRSDRGGYVLQTDASVSFGSSGGGLFDQNGDLIGVTNSVDKYSRNIAFAIPSEWITQILFPVTGGDKSTSKPLAAAAVKDISIKKLGNFGKDNVTLYQSGKNQCFVFFTGKNQYGEMVSSALWYPEKPEVILVFPSATDITKTFAIMSKAFTEESEEIPTNSNDFLMFADKKNELVGVRDQQGKFPLLVTKLPINAKDEFLKSSRITVNYKDGITMQGFSNVQYGLDGFKDTMSAYQRECK